MNNQYLEVFEERCGSWENVTPNVIEDMFECAENRNFKLESFRKWLHSQPITEYTKERIDDKYSLFV